MQSTKDILQDVYIGLQSIFGVKMRTAILYGSYARGDYDAESDVDVAAIIDMTRQELKSYHQQIVQLMADVFWKHEKLVSIVEIPLDEYNVHQETLPFYRNISREGVLLHVG